MKYVIGNWKMNGQAGTARTLAAEVAKSASPAVKVVICPPFALLQEVGWAIKDSQAKLGAQDCHAQGEGAHTGDVSAAILKSVGASYVILGHSERRAGHGETSVQVRQKAEQALKAGLMPIICIGETLEECEAGKAAEVVSRQLAESVPAGAKKGDFILAYEPVWAIGSGKTPTEEDIRRMHACVTSAVPGADVLYGGSVNASNAAAIMAIPGVSGVLVGGASLKLEEFSRIIAAAKK